jgi:hypothetical protein
MEESIRHLEAFRASGVEEVVLTPHLRAAEMEAAEIEETLSLHQARFSELLEVTEGRAEYPDLFLRPLFHASIEVVDSEVTVTGTGTGSFDIRNHSDVDLQLRAPNGKDGWMAVDGDLDLQASGTVTIPAHRLVRISVWNPENEGKSGTFPVVLRYQVTNFITAPETGLEVEIPVTVRVVREG